MSRQPFDPAELGASDEAVDPVAMALERYASGSDQAVPHGLINRVSAAIEAEPIPRRGWFARLGAGSAAGPGSRALGFATLAAAVALIAIAVGGVIDLARNSNVGTTSPAPVVSPSDEASPTTEPSPSLSPVPSASPSASPDASESDSPSPSATATASDDDNSGPGGGGDDRPDASDSSGPGGSGSSGGGGGSDDD